MCKRGIWRVTIITTYRWELWRILRTSGDDDEARNSREMQKISVSRRHEDLWTYFQPFTFAHYASYARWVLSNLMITPRPIFWLASGRIIVSDESWLTFSWYRQYVWSHTQQCRDDRVAGKNESVQSRSETFSREPSGTIRDATQSIRRPECVTCHEKCVISVQTPAATTISVRDSF